MLDFGIGDDLKIASVERRATASGTWVRGTVAGFRFNALVYDAHASQPEFELGDSRVSKLWLQRITDGRTAYNFDRGLDIAATDPAAQAVVDFLTAGLASYVFGT